MSTMVSILLVTLYIASACLIKRKNILTVLLPLLISAAYIVYGMISWKEVYQKTATGAPLYAHFMVNHQTPLLILLVGVLATLVIYRFRFYKNNKLL